MATKAERVEGVETAQALLAANGFVPRWANDADGPHARRRGRPQLALAGTDVRAVIGLQTTTIYRVDVGGAAMIDVIASVDTLDVIGIWQALADMGAAHEAEVAEAPRRS